MNMQSVRGEQDNPPSANASGSRYVPQASRLARGQRHKAVALARSRAASGTGCMSISTAI